MPQKLHPRFIITTMLIKIATNRLRAASGSGRLMRCLYDVTLYALSLAPAPHCFYEYNYYLSLNFLSCLISVCMFKKFHVVIAYVNDYCGNSYKQLVLYKVRQTCFVYGCFPSWLLKLLAKFKTNIRLGS